MDGVVIRPLQVNRDPRGTLTETLKITWKEICDQKKRPFTQMYFSKTLPGVARDEDKWHFHPRGQEDRFAVLAGDIVIAIYDRRKDSPTKDFLNLFLMGESQGDTGQYLLLIPFRTLHGFVVVSKKPTVLINYPTRLYDSREEKRIPFTEEKLPDGSIFTWDLVRKHFM